MELRSIRYFVAVGDYLNFSRTAEALGVSQSALSRQIQSLEKELNVRLFDRLGRRLALTAAGKELVARARPLLQGAESLRDRARDLSGGSSGVLAIGATPQSLESLVCPVLGSYRKDWPHVGVRLVEGGAGSLLDDIERGSVDVVIAPLPKGEVLEGKRLFPLAALAALPPRHRLAGRAALDVTDLEQEPVLLLKPGFMTRQLFDGACQLAHVTPQVVLESASPHCLLALARGGHGIAIIPSTVQLSDARPNVARLLQDGKQLGLWLSVIWNPRRYLTPAARGFIDEIFRFTRRDYPGKDFGLREIVDSTTAAKRS